MLYFILFYHEYKHVCVSSFRTTGCTNQTALFLFEALQFRMAGVLKLLKLNSLVLLDAFDMSFQRNV